MRALLLFVALLLAFPAAAGAPRLPAWLAPPPGAWPPDPAQAALGRRLFYDTRLSITGRMSCATCHQQALAFTDGRKRAMGATGEPHPRNTPSLANVAYRPFLTRADPGLRKLEEQLRVPLFGAAPVEMGMAGREGEVVALLRADRTYVRMFDAAFGGPATIVTMARAIAAFERTLISTGAPWDRYLRGGEPDAISPAAKRGAALFFSQRLGCGRCHGGPMLSDTYRDSSLPFDEVAFHNTGAGVSKDRGLAAHTGRAADEGRFQTPSLRNVAVTAPYMHDGSIATLGEVIDFYAGGGKPRPNLSGRMHKFEISAAEKRDVIAFLESLTDAAFLSNPAFADPFSGD